MRHLLLSKREVSEWPTTGSLQICRPNSTACALRTNNCEQNFQPSRNKPRGWRGWLAVVLIVLFAVSLAPTNTATWFIATVFDEDTFVDTLAPLPRDPAVSTALGITLAEALIDQDEATVAVAETLPPDLEFMAAPLASALRNLAVRLSQEAIASDAFASTWQVALRTSHKVVIALLGGASDGLLVAEDGAIVLDLSGLANDISAKLSEVGIDFAAIEKTGLLER